MQGVHHQIPSTQLGRDIDYPADGFGKDHAPEPLPVQGHVQREPSQEDCRQLPGIPRPNFFDNCSRSMACAAKV